MTINTPKTYGSPLSSQMDLAAGGRDVLAMPDTHQYAYYLPQQDEEQDLPCDPEQAYLPWSVSFIRQLEEKDFRDNYVADQVRTRIALLIRTLREQFERQWSQAELGRRVGKPQSVISRLEDPDYGKWTLQTLLEVAAAFDLPLFVDMPEWEVWARLTESASASTMERASFNVEYLVSLACKSIKGHVIVENHPSQPMLQSELSPYLIQPSGRAFSYPENTPPLSNLTKFLPLKSDSANR